jgi:ADP-heptose:LPS heptosyltransferase
VTKAKPSSRTQRTLVVQLADLGDLTLAAPAIQGLRDVDGADVTLLTKLSNEPLASAVGGRVIFADKHLYDRPGSLLRPSVMFTLVRFIMSLRRQSFDRIILLHHLTTRFGAVKFAALSILSGAHARVGLDNGRGWFLTRSRRDHGFGAANEQEYWTDLTGCASLPELPTNGSAARALLDHHGVTGPYVVLHPGSGVYSVARRWPPSHFRALAQILHDRLGQPVVIVGGPDEASLCTEIVDSADWAVNLAGKTDIPNLVSVLDGASLYIGNDGGVSQLASRLRIPSLVIFGPTSPKTWHVASRHSRALTLHLACSPCVYHHFELGTPAGCATRECLVRLSPSDVARQAAELLETPVAL